MRKNRRVVSLLLETLALVCFFLFPLLSFGVVRHVPGEYSSIQEAIDAATDGDEIIVSPGTYYENINFNGKNIILRSTDPTDPSVVASTIIDGNQAGSVVTFSGTELTTSVLAGFTITNGNAPDGGGIKGNGTFATIQNNMVTTNTAHGLDGAGDGGGLYGCHGTVQYNTISGNSAGGIVGGGGGLAYCHGTIQHNIISANRSTFGGGLYNCDGIIQYNIICNHSINGCGGGLDFCDGIIQNNTVYDNSAASGGGLHLCHGSILNNTISRNSASHGGGLYSCNGILMNNTISANSAYRAYYGSGLYGCEGLIINCIIWANLASDSDTQLSECSTPLYSCIQDWTHGGRGNISSDPRFVDPDNRDYHLQPDSPCIDTGNTYYLFGGFLTDIDGECRLAGSSLDMGCDEFGSSLDSDGDLLADSDEASQGSDPNNPDTDADGLNDGIEVHRGTAPIVSDIPQGISIPADYSSVQQGIFLAFPLETITIQPGAYYENLHLLGKNITLQSTNPLDDGVVNNTRIDGEGLFPVILFQGTENETCVVKGVTICNGASYRGGGIQGNGTLATIENNKILDNWAYEGGGLYECDGIIQNNIIRGNRANGLIPYGGLGGGLYGCDGTMRNNIISENVAVAYYDFMAGEYYGGWGGGLFLCRGIILNNTIHGNSARNGGGLRFCDSIIQNNTISGNSAGYGGTGGGLSYCTGFINNCIIWANSADTGSQLYNSSTPVYSCIQDWTDGRGGNISSDPKFIDPSNGDYHLQPDSPCIDAGNTYYLLGEYIADVDGECRVAGRSLDIGSDEFGSSPDSDGDLLADSDEMTHGTDLNNIDTDRDGLIDGVEVLRGTLPVVFDAPSGISVPSDYSSIQQGLFMAFPLEVIAVSPGTYYENLYFLGKNITLQSQDPGDDAIISSTIIDGNGLFSVILFEGTENEACVVKGLTIRKGDANVGGGICGNNTLATIEKNKILDNSANSDGGGLYKCLGTIQNNIISGNLAQHDGGALSRCHGTVQNNIISGNSGGSGGGLDWCQGTIQNNIISGNSAQNGGGLGWCYGTIQNNTIYNNWVSLEGGGVCGCHGIIRNCIVWQNTATTNSQISYSSIASYSCIQDWTGGGTGNISDDPQLVDPDNGDFHLLASSPCIDAGGYVDDLNEDFEGDARPIDGTSEPRGDGSDFDIGADEFIGKLVMVPRDYLTIQEAINAASDGDEIIVSPGTYYENINFNGKNIILCSTDPTSPVAVAATVIDGGSTGSVVTLSGSETARCVLSGLTITNGYALYGGGINGNGSLATIQNNRITTNTAYYPDLPYWYVGGYGGGLYRCNGTIERNLVSGNEVIGSRSNGGGLCECNGSIRNNIISGNYSDSYGGGFYSCNGSIQSNTISDNLAHFGGGLFHCNGIIRHNRIQGNIVYGRPNSAGGGLRDCQGTIQNNIISENIVTSHAYYSSSDSIQNAPVYGNAFPYIPYYRGGGLSECNGTIVNNLISGNTVTGDYGYGGGLADCNGTIENNTIYGNFAKQGGGLAECRGFIINCIFWANSATFGAQAYDSSNAFYSCIEDWSGDGIGNISTDPQFNDAANGDFHITADCPCIDTGDKFYLFGEYIADIDGECRIVGISVDMGCDEYNSLPDSDGDLLADSDEGAQGTASTNPDSDGDGLQDGVEVFRGTDPASFNLPSGISIPADYTSVQQGIFLAFAAEEIVVSPGTYYENLHLLSKNLILQSINPLDDDIVSSTTIDGNASFSVMFFTGAENESCLVRGLTLRNGYAPYGGGICGNGTLATIGNSRIVGNSALLFGSGLSRCDGVIQKNIIYNNSVTNEFGHGGALEECNGIIQNNIIAGNSARGGGMVHCNGTIQNNTVYGNLRGCGIYECKGSIKNCIVWEHRYLEVFNCSQPTYSCIQDWTWGGTGNISADPQLVDPASCDFRLLPSSPCIDAGGFVEGLTEDFEDDLRPYDGTAEPRGDGSDFDIGADEFTGVVRLKEYDFELTDEGWTSFTLPRYFTPPECFYLEGHVVLTAQDNTNTYGFWTSEADAVPVIADCLYRARWTVATDVTDPLAVPHMQLRVISQNFQQADILVVSSCGDGSYAPTPEGRTYEMYFIPPESCVGKPEDQDDLIPSFDILNFDPSDAAQGSLMLDNIVVDAIPLDTLGTPTVLKTWSFDTGTEGWEFGSVPVFTAPLSGIGSGALWLIAQDNTSTFGYWSGPSEEVEMETGKLYRLRFTVITDVTAQEQVPHLRLRVSSEDFQSSIMKVISSYTGAEMSPTPQGRTYDLYFSPPQSLVGTETDSILAAFDILNFDPADAPDGALLLDSVNVESLKVP